MLKSPPKVEYSLTEYGAQLEPLLLALRDWGSRYMAGRTKSTQKATP
ncbi:winged helix-turn-helix transcriptional regulator [Legionella taurinensis]